LRYYQGAFGGNISLDYLKEKAPITLALIVINLTIFIVINLFLGQERELILWGGMAPIQFVLMSGEYWRFFTSMFIHSGIMHVIFNMIFLLHAGGYIEPYIGRKNFIAFYLLSGLLVSLCAGIFTNAISVGASGAVFALLGFLLYFDLQARRSGQPTNSIILPLVVINMIITVLIPNISLVGHLSGLIIGFLYGAYRWNKSQQERRGAFG